MAFPSCPKGFVLCVLLTAITYVAVTLKMPDFFRSYLPKKIALSSLWSNFPEERDLDTSRISYLPLNYTVNVEDLCRENDSPIPIGFVVIVASAPKNFQRRNAIRQTWGRDLTSSPRNKVVFILGKSQDPTLEHLLWREYLRHSDIIQGDFVDTYSNLTIKSVAALRWGRLYCPQAFFLAKIDDDIFLNVPNFLRVLESLPRNAIYGKLFNHTKPIRDPQSPWVTSYKEYPAEHFPDFISGTTYVVGGDVLRLLYKTTGTLRPFRLEDVFVTGFSAEVAGIPRVGVPGFNTLPVNTACEMRHQVTSHYMQPEMILNYSKELSRHDLKC